VRPPSDRKYRRFPDRARKNLLQRWPELPAMTRTLRLPRHARLLEIGCGRGVALEYFEERLRPERLVGLDNDAGLLEEAAVGRSGTRTVELVHGDARALPFPDASFDLVIDFGTLFHIARAERAVAEIARVLAPGGLFVHETWLSQLVSHPLDLLRHRTPAPWRDTQELVVRRRAGLWTSRERVDR